MLHLLNSSLRAIPHPTLKDRAGKAVLKGIESLIEDKEIRTSFNHIFLGLISVTIMTEVGSYFEKNYSTKQSNISKIPMVLIIKLKNFQMFFQKSKVRSTGINSIAMVV